MKIPDRARRVHAWLHARRRFIETWVLVMLLVFSVAQSAYFNSVQQEQVQRNSLENDCQTAYAVALTDALQDRDAVTVIARSESVKLWQTFRDLLVHPLPGDQGRKRFLEALQGYLRALRHVSKAADINPYPDLVACFNEIDEKLAAELAIELSSATFLHGGQCLGLPVTIWGSRGGDVIHGTDKPDVIRSRSGVDLIVAGRGRDRICAGRGSDIVNAGQGFDRVKCGPGVDNAQQAERRRGCEF